jgi:DNA-binding transcriptional ArsR family regulator
VPKTSAKAADRTNEEATSYALGHRTRVEILSALNEGNFSASELARVVGQPLSSVTHHLAELLASGSISVVDVREVGNVEQKVYSSGAIRGIFFDEEECASWPFERRQATHSRIIQSSGAEAINSLWSGAISNEPKSWLVWKPFKLDDQGWLDACAVFQAAWDRLNAIEEESNDRRAESGEEARPYVCNLQAYPRTGTGRGRATTGGRGIPFDI